MTRVKEYEPPGWRDLCAKLQAAKDPEEFQAIVEQINQLLTAFEKTHPERLESDPQLSPPTKKRKSAIVH
ncbi:MAG TPA: hypothetical protein VL983_00140 [Terriglobales bacterium]|nr:hypothetical protein [Terriglobales bacterium]